MNNLYYCWMVTKILRGVGKTKIGPDFSRGPMYCQTPGQVTQPKGVKEKILVLEFCMT